MGLYVTEFRKITRVSPFSGKTHTLTIGADPKHWEAWKKGALIHKAFPDLSPDQREFIQSGITPEEWDAEFKEDE
jgi:hypothetical protein